jgi:coproporphyrinogen III oxidase-like Fe-S oxidoreductase
LSAKDIINEMIMIQLRTIDGLDLKFLRNELKYDIEIEKKDDIVWLIAEHKIVIDSEKLRLTRDGKLIADYITEKLIK